MPCWIIFAQNESQIKFILQTLSGIINRFFLQGKNTAVQKLQYVGHHLYGG